MAHVELSWRDWYDRHCRALLLLARQLVPTRADAEDAVQNGFVRFWRARHHVQDPAAYLYACVRTAALDLRRSERRRQARDLHKAEEPLEFEPPAGPAHDDGPPIDPQRIAAALTLLPDEQREIVVMKIWGGLTFAQIAETLGTPLSTAASRYRYALLKLEQLLRAEMSHGR